MPKLYFHLRDWIVPGQQPKGASRVDIPSNPVELAAWLNHRRVPIAMPLTEPTRCEPVTVDEIEVEAEAAQLAGATDPIGNPHRCAKCRSLLSATEAGAGSSAASLDLTAIETWLDEAPRWAIDRLAEQIAEARQ